MTADHSGERPTLSLTSLTLAAAAQVLTRTGGRPITIAMLEADLAQGAPTNPDGTLNLVHYAAWLVQEMTRGN